MSRSKSLAEPPVKGREAFHASREAIMSTCAMRDGAGISAAPPPFFAFARRWIRGARAWRLTLSAARGTLRFGYRRARRWGDRVVSQPERHIRVLLIWHSSRLGHVLEVRRMPRAGRVGLIPLILREHRSDDSGGGLVNSLIDGESILRFLRHLGDARVNEPPVPPGGRASRPQSPRRRVA